MVPEGIVTKTPRARSRPAAALVTLLLAHAMPLTAQARSALPIRIRAEHRTRFEQLERDFRASPTDGLTAAALRTLLSVELGPSAAHVALELDDSRVYADHVAPLNTTQVNALELLSAYVGLRRSGLFVPDDTASLRIGRLTLDRGNRRLVARNRFRNTINSFTGLDVTWSTPSRAVLAFALLPITRRPSDPASLADNRIQIDKENTDALFWGVEYEVRAGHRVRGQAYVIGLQERDGEVLSANRRLVTPGVRVFRQASPGAFDFELEAMLQTGRSRASSSASDTSDLTHRAYAVHASGGYSFRAGWSPRVSLQYDYASGDRHPDDLRNGRFDPLFGARAFELNRTGFYGPFARSNISSPGMRLETAPWERLEMVADYRLYWLASARDAWTTAGLRDPTGEAGSFVGHQIEARMDAHLVPRLATLEVGGAVLSRGAFARHVNGGRIAAAVYFYTQVTLAKAWW